MTETKTTENTVSVRHPYSCMGSPPTGKGDEDGEKKPTDVAREFHEKQTAATVADMRGQLS